MSVISLFGILFIYLIIKNKSIENENIDKLIELGKWFMVSVAITLSTSIINDSFREREQDIKEMEFFDKYVNTISSESIEKRRLLSEYFALVSPEGEIREAWERYKGAIDKHLAELKADEPKIIAIAAKDAEGTASPAEIEELNRLQEKASVLRQSLISISDQDIQEWVIIAGSDESQWSANAEVSKVQELKYPATVYKKLNRFRTVVGPFSDRNTALASLPIIRQKVRADAYLVNLKAWCRAATNNKDGYLECKL